MPAQNVPVPFQTGRPAGFEMATPMDVGSMTQQGQTSENPSNDPETEMAYWYGKMGKRTGGKGGRKEVRLLQLIPVGRNAGSATNMDIDHGTATKRARTKMARVVVNGRNGGKHMASLGTKNFPQRMRNPKTSRNPNCGLTDRPTQTLLWCSP